MGRGLVLLILVQVSPLSSLRYVPQKISSPLLRSEKVMFIVTDIGESPSTLGFQGLGRPIVFRQVFRSSATKMSPAGPSHNNFLVLDLGPRSGLSFFREGRQRFRAGGEGKYFAAKKESLIPKNLIPKMHFVTTCYTMYFLVVTLTL